MSKIKNILTGAMVLIISTALYASGHGGSYDCDHDHNEVVQHGNNGHMSMQDGMMMHGNMSMQRHRFIMQYGIPSSYDKKQNPNNNVQASTLEKGKSLYQSNCASCHDDIGQGNGSVAANLNPKPTNIALFSKMPMATDGYLYWTIVEGGAPVQSAMPAFKQILKEEEIWDIVTYLRNLN